MNARLEASIAPLRAQLAAWYSAREPREQQVLRVAVFAVPVLLLLSALAAAHAAVTRLEHRVAARRADLAYLQSVLPVLQNAPHPTASDASLVALVDAGSREAGLTVAATDPVGPNQLRIRLENAPFDSLVGWLVRLQQTQGIAVQAASIDRAGGPGQVNANLTLARP